MKAPDIYFTFATCIVTALSGFAQSGPPSVVRQPASRMPYVGGNATFSVIVTGAPPPSFQWRFRGVDLPQATNSSLVINAQFTNAGPYSVIVSNNAGCITS